MNKYILSVARHLLTAVAGFLVAKGVLDEETASRFADVGAEVLLGIALFLIGQYFSITDKVKVEKKLQQARETHHGKLR